MQKRERNATLKILVCRWTEANVIQQWLSFVLFLSSLAPSVRVGSLLGGSLGIAPPLGIVPPLGITPPLNVFTPAVYGGPLFGGVGNSAGYSFESYSGPGYSYHYERMY